MSVRVRKVYNRSSIDDIRKINTRYVLNDKPSCLETEFKDFDILREPVDEIRYEFNSLTNKESPNSPFMCDKIIEKNGNQVRCYDVNMDFDTYSSEKEDKRFLDTPISTLIPRCRSPTLVYIRPCKGDFKKSIVFPPDVNSVYNYEMIVVTDSKYVYLDISNKDKCGFFYKLIGYKNFNRTYEYVFETKFHLGKTPKTNMKVETFLVVKGSKRQPIYFSNLFYCSNSPSSKERSFWKKKEEVVRKVDKKNVKFTNEKEEFDVSELLAL